MKVERVHEPETPDGWELLTKWNHETGEEEATGLWTAYEMADHLEACEQVLAIGQLADRACARPEIDVRGNIVFLTVRTPGIGLIQEDMDLVKLVDRELGDGQRANALLERKNPASEVGSTAARPNPGPEVGNEVGTESHGKEVI